MLCLIPMALVVRQPDLGTAISFTAPAAHALLGRHAPHIRVFCPLSPAERCLFLRTLMAGSSSLSVRYFYHRQQHGRAFTTGTSSIHGNNLPNKPQPLD